MIETVRIVSKETSVIRARTISQNVTNTVVFIEKLLQGKIAGKGRGRMTSLPRPERKHVSPSPWSEGDGRKFFARRAASIGLGMVLNCLGAPWIFSLLKETPTGRGLWRASRRTAKFEAFEFKSELSARMTAVVLLWRESEVS